MNRVLFLILFLTTTVIVQAQKVWTLQECIAEAVENNLLAQQAELQTDAAAVNYKQSKAYLLPTVNGSITHGINQGRSIDPFTNAYVNQQINFANYGLGSGVVLFNGFSLRHAIRQNEYALEASRMEHQQVQDNVALDVILAYLQVLNNEDLLAIAIKTAEVTREQVKRLEVLNKEGAISPPQLHELTGQLRADEVAVVNAQNALATAKLSLAQLMNKSYNPDMQLSRASIDGVLEKPQVSVEEIYNKAINELALVKAAELRSQSAEAAVKSLRGALYPTVLLNGNLNTTYSSAAARDILVSATDIATSDYVVVNGSQVPVMSKQRNFTSEKIPYGSQLKNNVFSSVALGLRIPIFNAAEARNRVNLAKIQWKNNELIEANTKLQLKREIEQAHLNMMNAWERYKITADQVASFAEAFRAAEVRFNAGLGTAVEYLIAKINFDRANTALVIARYDYLFRKRILDYYADGEVR